MKKPIRVGDDLCSDLWDNLRDIINLSDCYDLRSTLLFNIWDDLLSNLEEIKYEKYN